MLKWMKLNNVGPSPCLEMDLAPRVNLITGDNGLGKTFLLDLIWFIQTHTNSGTPIRPTLSKNEIASIESSSDDFPNPHTSYYDRSQQAWTGSVDVGASSSLVIFAHVDGSFSVFDSVRSSQRLSIDRNDVSLPVSYRFSAKEIWDGLEQGGKIFCNGLIRDWVSWQLGSFESFRLLSSVLIKLSPPDLEPLRPGKPVRVSLDDVRDIPTLQMPYSKEVPLLHVSAGMRRIIALSYLLVWAWQEHLNACALLGEKSTSKIVFLIDEIDAHLHPRWQRSILGALLDVANVLSDSSRLKVQLICTTHSPMILASMEPLFEIDIDKLFLLDLKDNKVSFEKIEWAMQGDSSGWLVSEVFGLKQARSREAERAIEAAEAFMRGELTALPSDLNSRESIHAELSRVLAGHDPFWPRWVIHRERSVNK